MTNSHGDPHGDPQDDPVGQAGQQSTPMVGAETEDGRVMIVGPDGMAVEGPPGGRDQNDSRSVTELVEQPAKVMRIGAMIRQLLAEVKAAPLDEASRQRLKDIHTASIKELEGGLAPELIEELDRISLPFAEQGTPTEAELRIAQAQLVGWLEGLFHGIQTALFAQQMAARAQLEQVRRALPGAPSPDPQEMGAPRLGGQPGPQRDPNSDGMYL